MTEMQLAKIKAHVRWAKLADEDKRPTGHIDWEQGSWLAIELEEDDKEIKICTSTGCIAGHAALAAGGKIIIHETYYGAKVDEEFVNYNGERIQIRELGRLELGLNQQQAGILFDGDNGIYTLEMIVHEWQHGNLDFDPGDADPLWDHCEEAHDDPAELDELVNRYYQPVVAGPPERSWSLS